jgi:hypothetical protein
MLLNKKIFNPRKIRYYMFTIIILAFLFLISINYSVYVKTKAYEIYFKFDKSSLKSSSSHIDHLFNRIKPNENETILSNQPSTFTTTATLNLTTKQITTTLQPMLFSITNSYKHSNATELCSIIPPHLNQSKFEISFN